MGKDHSRYQQGVINRYYEHLDTIMLQKLQELVTDLYLAKNGPGEDKLWDRVEKAMVKMKIPKSIMEHLMVKRDVEILAQHVTQWLKKAK